MKHYLTRSAHKNYFKWRFAINHTCFSTKPSKKPSTEFDFSLSQYSTGNIEFFMWHLQMCHSCSCNKVIYENMIFKSRIKWLRWTTVHWQCKFKWKVLYNIYAAFKVRKNYQPPNYDRPGFLFGKSKGEMQHPSPIFCFYKRCINSWKFHLRIVQQIHLAEV